MRSLKGTVINAAKASIRLENGVVIKWPPRSDLYLGRKVHVCMDHTNNSVRCVIPSGTFGKNLHEKQMCEEPEEVTTDDRVDPTLGLLEDALGR